MYRYDEWLQRYYQQMYEGITQSDIIELEWEDTYDFIDSFLTTED